MAIFDFNRDVDLTLSDFLLGKIVPAEGARGIQSVDDYQGKDPGTAGATAPTNTGLGADHPANSVGAGLPFQGTSDVSEAEKKAPAYLAAPGASGGGIMPLWVYDISVDISISGVTAQSRVKRDFYPRFFTQPSFVVKCQTFSQNHYNMTSQFIRKHQLFQVVRGDSVMPQNNMMTLVIRGQENDNLPDRTTKGGYRGGKLRGYVENVTAGAERFNYAPEIEFNFILSDATSGIFSTLDAAGSFGSVGDYFAHFGAALEDPNIDPPKIEKKDKDEPDNRNTGDGDEGGPFGALIQLGDAIGGLAEQGAETALDLFDDR